MRNIHNFSKIFSSNKFYLPAGFFYLIHTLQLLNINCIFLSCDFKRNNIEETDFLKHLSEKHSDEILEISKKENMSIKAVEMITVSNSTVFINSNLDEKVRNEKR